MYGLIYIKCINNDRYFIALSTDVTNFIRVNKSRLKSGKHGNKRLQSDFNKYGLDCFEFSIIQESKPNCLESDYYNKLKEFHTSEKALYNEYLSFEPELSPYQALFDRITKLLESGKVSIDQINSGLDMIEYA